MSVLDRLASRLGERGDEPNRTLARELAAAGGDEEVAELAAGLESGDRALQSDCIKTLYEIGYIRPERIAGYADIFLRLLKSRDNRLVWGAMIALSTVARLVADTILKKIDWIFEAMQSGSVITVDNGIRVLAAVAAYDRDNGAKIPEYLMNHLKTCRASEVPQHAESSLTAINGKNKADFAAVLISREEDLSPAQLKRIKKLYKTLDKIG